MFTASNVHTVHHYRLPCGEVTGYGFGRFLLGRINGSTSFFFLGGGGRGTAGAPGRAIMVGCPESAGSSLSCAATQPTLVDLYGIWLPRSLESGLGLAGPGPRGSCWEVVYSR